MRGTEEIACFDWDTGNRGKNLKKHGVTDEESEEAFFDTARKVLKDTPHSGSEERYILLGETRQGKGLFIVFTIRKNRIRIISSRTTNKKERALYEKES